jgi:hypothetical protein
VPLEPQELQLEPEQQEQLHQLLAPPLPLHQQELESPLELVQLELLLELAQLVGF